MFCTKSTPATTPANLLRRSFSDILAQYSQECADQNACKSLYFYGPDAKRHSKFSTLTKNQYRRDSDFAKGLITEEKFIRETCTTVKDLGILCDALSRETKALKRSFAPKVGSRPQQINHVATQTACWFESNGNQCDENEVSNSIRRKNAERVDYYEKLNRENAEFYANLQREREKFYEKINREREEYFENRLIEGEQRYVSFPFTRDETLQPGSFKSSRLSAQAMDLPVRPYQIVRNIVSGQAWKGFFKRASKKGK